MFFYSIIFFNCIIFICNIFWPDIFCHMVVLMKKCLSMIIRHYENVKRMLNRQIFTLHIIYTSQFLAMATFDYPHRSSTAGRVPENM